MFSLFRLDEEFDVVLIADVGAILEDVAIGLAGIIGIDFIDAPSLLIEDNIGDMEVKDGTGAILDVDDVVLDVDDVVLEVDDVVLEIDDVDALVADVSLTSADVLIERFVR